MVRSDEDELPRGQSGIEENDGGHLTDDSHRLRENHPVVSDRFFFDPDAVPGVNRKYVFGPFYLPCAGFDDPHVF